MELKRPVYIDLFAGCGGISLGLMNAGWQGFFAIEKSPMAFETLKYNLIDGNKVHYNWPKWLSKEPHDICKFRVRFWRQLKTISGQIDLIAGGPPCQGYSFAGKRSSDDERNELFKKYIGMVKCLSPKIIFFENVEGITVPIGKEKKNELNKRKKSGKKPLPYSQKIENSLKRLGYNVFTALVNFSEYGIPQSRTRFILIGFDIKSFGNVIDNPFEKLRSLRDNFLKEKGLTLEKISIKDAISDLESIRFGKVPSQDSKGFYHGLKGQAESAFQKLMREDIDVGNRVPDSHRLVNHTQEIIQRFSLILSKCKKGVQINSEERMRYDTKKHCIVPADELEPSPTLTSLPDDLLHYNEPRVLTVREYARLQSFPDWFEFKNNYTTGGKRRKIECPRYTQVANAVPPLFAEILGQVLIKYIEQINCNYCEFDRQTSNSI
ncbi:DNA cytosine methyltransferase [Desulfofarcimen acetoxidans]|uniref:DNA cytosine methyltransferase n=1 Tax=Desulfofarcimen acetoxidans TaxID=58138 RepID=UPI0005A84363|nr:DNA cytosine methyltransferase [Desulfofarcimen acetoxidans]